MSHRLLLLFFALALLLVSSLRAAEEEALPPGAIARLGTLRFYHGGEIGALAVSPDGKVIASGGRQRPLVDRNFPLGIPQDMLPDPRIVLWDALGTKLHEIVVPSGPIHSLAFSLDGKKLAASFGQDRVGIWDVSTGQPWAATRALPLAGRESAFDGEGHLLMCDADGAWTALDLDTGKIVRRWNPWQGQRPLLGSGQPAEDCTFSQFSPDRQRLVFGFTRFKVEQTKDKDGKRVRERKFVRVVDAVTNKTLAELDATADESHRVAFSPDGKQMVTSCFHHLEVWDVGTGRKVRELWRKKYDHLHMSREDDMVHALAVSANTVVAIQADFGLRLWERSSGRLLLELSDFCSFLRLIGLASPPLALTPDGKTLLIGFHGVVRFWDVATATERLVQPGHRAAVSSIQFAADGRTLITRDRHSTYCWDSQWRPLHRVDELALHAAGRDFLGLSCDGKYSIEKRKIELFLCNATTGRPIPKKLELNGKQEDFYVAPASFSADGHKVLVPVNLSSLMVYDVADGKRCCHLTFPDGAFLSALSPDGSRLAVMAYYHGLELFDARTGKHQHTLYSTAKYKRLSFSALVFSADNRFLAAAPNSRTLLPLQGIPPEAEVKPDEETLRTLAVVYQVETGREVGRITGDPEKMAPFRGLALSPDGRFLASVNDGETIIRIWEVASGLERGHFDGHADVVQSLAFAPDGRMLLSGSQDSTVLVWRMDGPISRKKQGDQPTAKEALALWDDLAGKDGLRIDDAVWSLVRSPDTALPLLREKLPPMRAPAPETLARWLAELDHNDFEKREAASGELEAQRELIEPLLRAALKQEPSLEKRKRLERLLNSADKPTSTMLRQVRAVEVLERIGSPEARKLLAALADGASAARLTREATAALRRLQP